MDINNLAIYIWAVGTIGMMIFFGFKKEEYIHEDADAFLALIASLLWPFMIAAFIAATPYFLGVVLRKGVRKLTNNKGCL